MSVYCPPADFFPQLSSPTVSGTSEAANRIECQLKEQFRHYVGPRFNPLRSGIEELAADVNATAINTISSDTVLAAIEFARLLPRALPPPEIASDADGEISFDWFGRSGKIFSVSIDATGRLAYAGRFGEKSKIHGTEQLSEACPLEVIRGIAKATS
jgi:hypothetical protein